VTQELAKVQFSTIKYPMFIHLLLTLHLRPELANRWTKPLSFLVGSEISETKNIKNALLNITAKL